MAIASKRRPKTAADRKRAGHHHHHGKSYLKTYWPYLPLLAIVLLGIVINGVWSNQMRGVQGYATDISPASLLDQTNQQRIARGEQNLTINPDLATAAQAKANNMVQLNYWSHVSPSGEQPWQFDTDAGYQYQSAGENLAYGFGSSSQVMSAWMASTEHRDNILDGNYQNVGFGIANSPDFQGRGPATIVVAEYGQPLAPVAEASAASGQTKTPAGATVSTAPVTSALPASQNVSRVQLLSGGASYAAFLTVVIAGLAAVIFLFRHGLAFKKLLVEGEEFVIHHGYFDILIVALAVAGIILTRTVGVIH